MNFLLDVCISSRALQQTLVDLGHDVISAYEIDPKAADDELLAAALAQNRILVTEDTDFGELVFVQGLPHGTIVRLVDMTVAEHILAMNELFATHAADLGSNAIIVVTPHKIRVRH